MADQALLVRIVRGRDGRLLPGGGLPGRGAWLCDGSRACFELARRSRSFGRALRCPVSGADLAALEEALFTPGAARLPPPA